MYAALVDTLTQWFQPWQDFYGDSVVTETAVTAMHLLAMLFGGGLAIAADRATLKAGGSDPATRASMLETLHASHRPVIACLGILVVTGVAMAAADVATFAVSLAFAIKLILVALLAVNGTVLYATEGALRRQDSASGWRRLRMTAWMSLILWSATLVAGVALVNVA